MLRIRGGSGLGDSLYIRPVADFFVRQGEQVMVLTDHPDVFIGSGVSSIQRHRKTDYDILAHYTAGKSNPHTNQWQDVCARAGVGDLPLSFKWKVRCKMLVDDLLAMAKGKPLILLNGGRYPMNRTDGFANEMLPDRAAFDALLEGLQRDCFVVEVGQGVELYPLTADVDLVGRTSVSDVLDIASVCDAMVGQCSFMIPLAECFDKPLMVVWAARGLESKELYIRQCTPQKILSKKTSRFMFDNWSPATIASTADEFLSTFTGAASVI